MPILWVLLLLSCATCAYAQSTSGYCGYPDSTGLQWNYDASQHTLTITGSGLMKDYSLDTKAPWYALRDGIKLVVIGDGVTSIGSYAFWNIPMDSVSFGNTLETIRGYAFQDCPLLRLDFPGSLQRIGPYAFYSNHNLKVVDFGASEAVIDYYAFAGLQSLQTIICSKVKDIQWRAFENCTHLVNLQLGDSLMHIGDNAFHYCLALRKIYIPASVTQIEGEAFSYTTALDTIIVAPDNPVYNSNGDCNAIMRTNDDCLIVGCRSTTIPATTKSIDYSAFRGCTGLQSITLPEGLESVGTQAFYDCTGLQTVNFPNSIIYAGCQIFTHCSSLTSSVYNNRLFVYMPMNYAGAYVIPSTIREICCGAFESCSQLTSITLPDSITTIPVNAFYGCSALTSITIPDAVTSIASYAFYGCSSLSSIIIPANLQTLGENAFGGCSNVKHITWNAKDAQLSWIFYDPSYSKEYLLENMSWYHPFYDIRQQIQTFTLGDSVRVIPRYLCYGMENLTSLSIGCEVDSIEQYVFEGCTRIAAVHWNARTCTDPLLYTAGPCYPIRNSVTSFTFGDSVQHIPAYLCHGMNRLHHIHIPENVNSIGNYAFRYLNALDSISVHTDNPRYDSRGNCNALIETATDKLLLGCYKTRMPEDIRGIESCAFLKVRGLKEAIIPEEVSYIGTEAFNGCADLDTLVLPSGLKEINAYAFQDCGRLDTLVLPETIDYIGIRAFANCSGLKKVLLPESVDSLDQYIFSGCSGLEYIKCNATTPPGIQETTFRGTSCHIYVPCESIGDYREAPIWQNFDSLMTGWYEFVLRTRSNDDSFGWDTIYQMPDCETNAIIYAEARKGYEFVEWQDSLGHSLSTDALYEFYMDEDMSLTAVFKQKEEALDAISAQTHIWVNGHEVLMHTNHDTHAVLYDMTGRQVATGSVKADVESSLHAPAAGMYVAVVDGCQQKVIVK